MLIPLFLYDRKLLREAMFFMSEYLEQHRGEYYDRLLAVSRDGDWTGWCEFFLRAVEKQASQNEARARRILELYEQLKIWIGGEIRSSSAIRALDFVFANPVFSTTRYFDTLDISQTAARRILTFFVDNGVLLIVRQGSGRRPAVYAFVHLLNIAEGRVIA